MNLIIAGCEYTGTTPLAKAIASWAQDTMGGTQDVHDHFKIPHIACYWNGPAAEPLTNDELTQIMSWSPKLKEMAQRQSLNYHMPNNSDADDYILVGYHIDDAAYAPTFFGYGHEKELQGGWRWKYARHIEGRVLEQAPDTVLVMVTASEEAIAARMEADPHPFSIVQKKDIESVLEEFQREFDRSIIHTKIAIDTSNATVEDALEEFKQAIQPHLTIEDRRRIALKQAS